MECLFQGSPSITHICDMKDGRRWKVSTQEQEGCYIEIEMDTFVVKNEFDRPSRSTGVFPYMEQFQSDAYES